MKMRPLLLVTLALLAACSRAPEPPRGTATVAAAPVAAEIDWVRPQSLADVDRAFEDAKANSKPVFLFWTAAWCPPCNQVKSTIFSRPEFVEKSRAFVPVYVDADSPSGQLLGQRFKVSGYPTMVLLDGAGAERVRLAGSVDAAKYMQLLDRGLTAGRTAREALAAALAGGSLPAEDWRMLAFYSWSTDDGQLIAEKELPSLLLKLAAACPAGQPEACSRLVLHALWASAVTKDARPALDKPDAIASLRSLLAQPALVRDNHDLLGYGADDIVALLTEPKSKERADLIAQFEAALDRIAADRTLSNGGRLYALLGKVALARLEDRDGALPPALLEQVRAETARIDRETASPDERQSVITLAGHVLAVAGLLDESDALLTAELKRSHSPYYYMSQLASNAKKRGTPEGNAAAIDWARQAYAGATGTATRLRWGGSLVNTLLQTAPGDVASIEQAALQVLGELAPDQVRLAGNNRAALERMSRRLVEWNKEGRHDDTMARLNATVKRKCASDPSVEGEWCESLFRPARRV